jgi:hypothetical protein
MNRLLLLSSYHRPLLRVNHPEETSTSIVAIQLLQELILGILLEHVPWLLTHAAGTSMMLVGTY